MNKKKVIQTLKIPLLSLAVALIALYAIWTVVSPAAELFPKFQNFITIFLSIIVESLPFVVLGVIVSVIVALFVSEKYVVKLIPKNRFTSHFFFACFGIFIPVCQCGNIPVARRLMMQGFSTSEAMTFLLAAPIVNPITFLTTWEAFRFNHAIAIIRILSGFVIAYSIGIVLSYKKNQEDFLTNRFIHQCNISKPKRSLSSALTIFQSEFILIMKMLCLGAMVASAVQVFVPRTTLLSIGHDPFLSVIAMLSLGFVISICSTVDAFFVLPYANTFNIGSIMTFLVFGPLVDIKMLFMMKTAFKGKWLLVISLVIAVFSIGIGLVVNHFFL